ncbi:MAG: InlB B-repeat-containing protein [Aristaeellaceae bacterium]
MNRKHGMALLMILVLVLACSVAQATAVTHTVIFDVTSSSGAPAPGSVTAPATQNVEGGNTVKQPEAPSAVGYTFEGWYTEAACANQYVFTNPVTGDITLYAKWTAITPTVTFELNGGDPTWTGTNPLIVTYNATVDEPVQPTKTGYTFGGWYKEPVCATAFKFSGDTTPDTVTSDITLYAKWSINQYTVTFINGGHGVTPATQTVNHGDKATNPGDLVEQGWKFDGWYNGSTVYTFTEQVTADLTLTAHWTQQHKVTFNMNGHGSVIAPKTVLHGGTVTAPDPVPTAEGYAFGGWYQEAECTNTFNFSAPINEDKTVYAKWTATVTVTFSTQKANTNPSGANLPTSANIKLMSGNTEIGTKVVDTSTPAEWTGLDATKTYTVVAENVPANYTAVCTRTTENTFLVTYVEDNKMSVTITNKHIVDTIDMVISKQWNDNNNTHRPESITVKVYKLDAAGQKVLAKDKAGNDIVLTLNASNQWTAHVTDLYMRENGTTIQYIIEEDAINGYMATCQITVDAQGNYTAVVTNVLTGKLDIDGTKLWDDGDNRDGIRPDSVQLKIYENSISAATLVKNVIVTGTGNSWSWAVEDLPVYDKFGRPITYIVVEDPVPDGYTADTPKYITAVTP